MLKGNKLPGECSLAFVVNLASNDESDQEERRKKRTKKRKTTRRREEGGSQRDRKDQRQNNPGTESTRSRPETFQSDVLAFAERTADKNKAPFNRKKRKKTTHKDEVRLLHGPSGRRRASLFFVGCATSVEAIPFLRAPNSARSASYRQRCSTCHRVQAAPSNEGRIEEPVQPFFEDRSRSSVSLYIYIRHTCSSHPSSRCGLHIATKNRIPSRIPRDGVNAFFSTFSSTATFDTNDSVTATRTRSSDKLTRELARIAKPRGAILG